MARPKTFGVKKANKITPIHKAIIEHRVKDLGILAAEDGGKQPFILNIDLAGLVAGTFFELGLWDLVNDLLPMRSNRTNLSPGSWLLVLIQKLLSPLAPAGLHSLELLAKSMPVQLFAPEVYVTPEMINRHAATRFIDRVAEYGPSKFFMEIASKFVDPSQIEVLHGDSTSTRYYGAISPDEAVKSASPNDDICLSEKFWADKEHLLMRLGYSRDSAPHLPQACHFGLASKVKCSKVATVVHFASYSGNINDKASFARIMQNDLPKIKETYTNLKRIVMDNAGATVNCASAIMAVGLHLITRLSDNIKAVKEAQKALYSGDNDATSKLNIEFKEYTIKNDDGSENVVKMGRMKSITMTDTKDQVKKLGLEQPRSVTFYPVICQAEASRAQKTKSVNRKAEKQANQAKIAIDKISTACAEDALKEFDKLKKRYPLCKFSTPTVDQKEKKTSKVKKSNNSSKDQEFTCHILANVSVDADKVKNAIESELLYVMATTDPSLSPEQIYAEYHNQSNVEGFWKEMKERGEFMDAIFLKNPDRIQALYSIIAIAITLARYITNTVRKVMTEYDVPLVVADTLCTSPTWSTLKDQISRSTHATLFVDESSVKVLWNRNQFLSLLVHYMSESVQVFYRASMYTENNGLNRLWEFNDAYRQQYEKRIDNLNKRRSENKIKSDAATPHLSDKTNEATRAGAKLPTIRTLANSA